MPNLTLSLVAKLNQSLRRNYRWDYVLFVLLGLLSFTWFREDAFISTTVFSWRTDFFRYLKTTLFVWDGLASVGFSAARNIAFIFPYITHGAIIQLLFGLRDSPLYERLLFYICFAGSGISAYYFLRTLKLNRIPCLLGALFYMFNTFGTVVIWYLAVGFFFPFYAFFPLMVALYIRTLQGELSPTLAVGIIFLTPAISTFSNPAFFILLGGVLGIYTLATYAKYIVVKDYIGLKRVVLRAAQFGLLFALLNFFWILPLLGDLRGQYTLASNEAMGLIGDLETLQQNSVQVGDALRLQGLWSFYGGSNDDLYYPWSGAFKTPWFGLLSYLPVLVVGAGAWAALKSRRMIWFVWPFLLAICLVLTSGLYSDTRTPSTSLVAVLVRNFYTAFPFLARTFRGGYTKYGLVLVLVLAVLLARGIQWLGKFHRVQLLLALAGIILLLGFPLLTGDVVYQGGRILKPFFVKIPEDYRQFAVWDQVREPGLDRYLSLPLFTTYNTTFDWELGYHGRDYLLDFSTRAVIGSAGQPLIKVVGEQVNQGAADIVGRLGGLLNVRYLVFRGDAGWDRSETMLNSDPARLAGFLEGFELEEQLGKLHLYRADERYLLPRLFVPELLIVSQNKVEEFPQLLSAGKDYPGRVGWYLASGEAGDEGKFWAGKVPRLKFVRVNPTKYRVKVSGATDPYHLVLNEGFHNGWRVFLGESGSTNQESGEFDIYSPFSTLHFLLTRITDLFLDNQDYGEEVASYFDGDIIEMTHRNTFLEPATFETWGRSPLDLEHLEVNGYANSWYIEPEDAGEATDYELVIEFGPQRWFYAGLGISILTLLSSILYLGVRGVRKDGGLTRVLLEVAGLELLMKTRK